MKTNMVISLVLVVISAYLMAQQRDQGNRRPPEQSPHQSSGNQQAARPAAPTHGSSRPIGNYREPVTFPHSGSSGPVVSQPSLPTHGGPHPSPVPPPSPLVPGPIVIDVPPPPTIVIYQPVAVPGEDYDDDILVGVVLDCEDQPGYDFSEETIGGPDDFSMDIILEKRQGEEYMRVSPDTDILDLGRTNSMSDVVNVHVVRWSDTHEVRLFVDHTYLVWTWDNQFVKFRVTALSADRVMFDWEYMPGSHSTHAGGARNGVARQVSAIFGR